MFHSSAVFSHWVSVDSIWMVYLSENSLLQVKLWIANSLLDKHKTHFVSWWHDVSLLFQAETSDSPKPQPFLNPPEVIHSLGGLTIMPVTGPANLQSLLLLKPGVACSNYFQMSRHPSMSSHHPKRNLMFFLTF